MQELAIDISYKELQLALLTGNVELSKLNIFAEKYIYIDDLQLKIHAGIIGTSHFIQYIPDQKESFTEILACNADEPKSSNIVFVGPIDQIKENNTIRSNQHNYTFNYRLQSYKKEMSNINAWNERIQKQNPLIHLEYQFHSKLEDLPTSKTLLVVQRQNNKLHIKTIHEYPEEDVIVVSNSKLVL